MFLSSIINNKQLGGGINRMIAFTSGVLMSINFVVFWAIPIMGMGSFYKQCLKWFLQPVYLWLEGNSYLRYIAAEYIYTKPEHADFFAMSYLLLINCIFSIGYVFYYQLSRGYLSAWVIAAYYCSWVGIGGAIMGAAYGLAHKEGHNRSLYKKGVRDYIGNFFENTLGVFFGNVPYNFSISHVCVHHKLDGGIGDSFYEWDIDRSSLSDFMLYVHRIFLHMIGYSSIKFLAAQGHKAKADILQKGVYYYIAAGVGILALTRSFSFVFWIYIEPLLCMTYFLALINIGFHGFIEFDENGLNLPMVNSTTIIEGEDDLFGEDDHMAHHYNTTVYYRDLPEFQKGRIEEYRKFKASVFKKLSIVELSIFIVLGLWDKLADHYVDYTGKMTREEIKEMLRVRSKRLETTYEQYDAYLTNPTLEAKRHLIQLSAQNPANKGSPTGASSPTSTAISVEEIKRQ